MVNGGCFYPWYKKGEKQPIPCGNCPLCRKRNLSQWSFRCAQELKAADSAYFITLTYNDSNVPFTPRHGRMALCKKHVQDFFKRLRKAHEPKQKRIRATSRGRLVELSRKRVNRSSIEPQHKPIKYLCVGEYGERYGRPHYHLLLFNCRVELIQDAWTNPITSKHIGHVDYGDSRGVSDAAAGYCLMYLGKPSQIGKDKHDDRPREFKLVSKGFGKSYLTDEQKAWHLADMANRMYCMLDGHKKVSMPRYYKLKLYSELQREEAFRIQTEKLIEQQLIDLMTKDALKVAKERRAWDERRKGAYRKMYSPNTKKVKL